MKSDLILGDCRDVMLEHGPYDLVIADPPYGDTALKWDKKLKGWHAIAAQQLKVTGSLWVFGSMRFFMTEFQHFDAAGLRVAQDIVWEKHNGSSVHTDRFNRVHEFAVQFYRKDAPWDGVWFEVPKTRDATARRIRNRGGPPHFGKIASRYYESVDGGDRLARSVIFMRSMHGRAIHETEKPVALLEILIRSSCPPGGLVGDFFAGSGSCGEAARVAGREYIGAEIDPGYHAAAVDRLSGSLPLVAP